MKPKSTKNHVSTMHDLFIFWCFLNRCFCSFSQGHFNSNIRVFHLQTNSLDTNEIVISIPHTLRKINKNTNFKNIQNQQKFMYQPWTIYSIFDVFEIGLFVHFPKGMRYWYYAFICIQRTRLKMKNPNTWVEMLLGKWTKTSISKTSKNE